MQYYGRVELALRGGNNNAAHIFTSGGTGILLDISCSTYKLSKFYGTAFFFKF
jgi:hypothetical protein